MTYLRNPVRVPKETVEETLARYLRDHPPPTPHALVRCHEDHIRTHLGNLKTLVKEAEEVLALVLRSGDGFDTRRMLERLRTAEVELTVAVEGAAEDAGLRAI